MKHSIRKKSASLSLSYSDGDYTNNLSGYSISYEIDGEVLVLEVDIEPNYRVRNKDGNAYLDAIEFTEKKNLLKSFELTEDQVYSRVREVLVREKLRRIHLRLLVGPGATCLYEINLHSGHPGSFVAGIQSVLAA